MKVLADLFPVLLFFAAYKFLGIYVATAVAILASFIQVAVFWFRHRRFESMQVITLAMIALLGGATLISHNQLFIKWKPTVINWIFGLLFLGSQFFGKQPFIQRIMQKQIQLPPLVWKNLNLSWVLFFFLTGLANLYVVYHFSTNAWVNFKLFGMMGFTLVFVFAQALYLARHMKHESR